MHPNATSASAPPIMAAETTPLTSASVYDSNVVTTSPPRGRWKDGLCSCCAFGPCHPHLLNAWCCPQILMAQVLTRMNMTWLGDKRTTNTNINDATTTTATASNNKTFRKIVILVVVYWTLRILLEPPSPDVEVVGDDMHYDVVVVPPNVSPWQSFAFQLLNSAFLLYTLIVLIKL